MLSRREFIKMASLTGLSLGIGPMSCAKEDINLTTPNELQLAARAEKAFDPKLLLQALDRILLWLKKHNPKTVSNLLPGLSENELKQKEKDLPFNLPKELDILYRWRNGQGTKTENPFIWYHDFPSLDMAIKEYHELKRLGPLGRWNASWFPFLTFMGEYYFIACPKEKKTALPIRFYFNEDPETHPVYINLTTMMLTAAEWYESGAVFVSDKTGALDGNVQAIRNIHQKYNRGLRFPYHVPNK